MDETNLLSPKFWITDYLISREPPPDAICAIADAIAAL
jgi:hypothetical protein